MAPPESMETGVPVPARPDGKERGMRRRRRPWKVKLNPVKVRELLYQRGMSQNQPARLSGLTSGHPLLKDQLPKARCTGLGGQQL